MEPKLFTIREGKILPSEVCTTIPAFINLMDEYESNAGKICALLHYLNSLNPETNPYAHIDEDIKFAHITSKFCPEINLNTPAFDLAQAEATMMYNTGPRKVFLAFKRLLEKLTVQIDNVSVDLTKDSGNMTQITAAVKNHKDLEERYNDSFQKYINSLSANQTRSNAKRAYDDDLKDEEDDDE